MLRDKYEAIKELDPEYSRERELEKLVDRLQDQVEQYESETYDAYQEDVDTLEENVKQLEEEVERLEWVKRFVQAAENYESELNVARNTASRANAALIVAEKRADECEEKYKEYMILFSHLFNLMIEKSPSDEFKACWEKSTTREDLLLMLEDFVKMSG